MYEYFLFSFSIMNITFFWPEPYVNDITLEIESRIYGAKTVLSVFKELFLAFEKLFRAFKKFFELF